MDAAVTVTSGDSLVVPRNAGREEECELANLCVNNPSFHFFLKCWVTLDSHCWIALFILWVFALVAHVSFTS